MQLLVEELGQSYSAIKQKITVGANPIYVYAVTPHIFKWLNPAGSLYVRLEDSSQTTITTSSAVTIQSITDATGNYFHGRVRFYLNAILAANTSYYISLISSGYTFSEAAWVGFVNDYDLQIVDRNYTPLSSIECPFLIGLWGYKEITKGRAL